ncbi:MAG: permease [Rhodobacteraceae bacterium]|nr:MAG: permease [Paracoccaceae bacterium]|tara:strand:+ start:117 stop:1028 length:912 start_codon:yes stop_codon:yes gene_type:complete
MQIYLPIAEMSVNVFLLVGLGGIVGILSGMFGVGGGFLMTPLLFFIGIPPAIAVASEANQILGASTSGAIAHFKRRTVDVKMGMLLVLGGVTGSAFGVELFGILKDLGQLELIIKICYVFFLGIIGLLMFVESIRALRDIKKNKKRLKKRHHSWMQGLPLKMRFRTSNLYISSIPAVVIGFFVGILASIMGVGGGFIMVPAMIYILGMPTKVVVGTSLFQIIFVTGATTFLHASKNFSVDIVLATLLLIGGVVGAQIGTRLGLRLQSEQLRILLAILVLAMCFKIALELFVAPQEIYLLLRRI